MSLKERVMQEVELLPEKYLLEIEQYLKVIKRKPKTSEKAKVVHLKGQYDDINVRTLAYE